MQDRQSVKNRHVHYTSTDAPIGEAVGPCVREVASVSAKNKRTGLLSAKFLVGMLLVLTALMAGAVADVGDLPAVLVLFYAFQLLGVSLLATGGFELAYQRGYSAFFGILCGLTWPIGCIVLLSLTDRTAQK